MITFNPKIKINVFLIGALASFIPWQSASSATLNSNGGFETGNFNGWTTIGDTSIQSGGPSSNSGNSFKQIKQFDGTYHALLTTACTSVTEQPTGFCTVSQGSTRDGQDDGETAAGTFNFSGKPVVNATTDSGLGDGFALQNFLGLSNTAFDIDPNRILIKEGSAIKQTFTVTQAQIDAGVTLDFAWAFLTNDNEDIDGNFGNDFAFYTLYKDTDAVGARTITVLQESDLTDFWSGGYIPPGATQFRDEVAYTTVSLNITMPGTYTIGFGVVDGIGDDLSSALLVDKVTLNGIKIEVPESSQVLGVLGLGLGLLLTKPRKKKN
jgi:hypothetical protein